MLTVGNRMTEWLIPLPLKIIVTWAVETSLSTARMARNSRGCVYGICKCNVFNIELVI